MPNWGYYLPIDGRFPTHTKILVSLRKVFFAKTTTKINCPRRGMSRCQNEMLVRIDTPSFLARLYTPKHENKSFAFIIQPLNNNIGKPFPTFSLMTCWLICLHSEYRVEQKYALFGPSC